MSIYISLPEIQQELERSIISTRFALSMLPREPSNDPRNEISNLLHGFVTGLVQHMEGISDEDGFIQSIRPAQETFKIAIRRTAPEFQPFDSKRSEGGSKSLGKAMFLNNEEEEVSETDDYDSEVDASFELQDKTSRKRKRQIIYIDEVFKRACR